MPGRDDFDAVLAAIPFPEGLRRPGRAKTRSAARTAGRPAGRRGRWTREPDGKAGASERLEMIGHHSRTWLRQRVEQPNRTAALPPVPSSPSSPSSPPALADPRRVQKRCSSKPPRNRPRQTQSQRAFLGSVEAYLHPSVCRDRLRGTGIWQGTTSNLIQGSKQARRGVETTERRTRESRCVTANGS